jgi:transposase
MKKNAKPNPAPRVVGLDCHPDTFTAALLRGPTPATAVVEQTFDQVPLDRLTQWARKHTTEHDQLVLEASGNSFQVVRTLATVGRKAEVLESCHLGKLKEAHANNDRISAVRIGKAYLAGTAKTVWVPDACTQERRDWFHCHKKAVKRVTQTRNRLRSYLSDNGVRLAKSVRLTAGPALTARLRLGKPWSPRQWQVLEGLLLELRQAEEQRAHWRSLIAQEVLADPQLLALVRLCGIRELVAFGVGAIIGDVHRFATPEKLVKYLGLNPAFDHSGAGRWSGGIAGHGRPDVRALLIEAAQSILRSNHPLAKWGKQLLARKGSANLAVAAVARKLAVAIWYLLMGRWSPLEEIDGRLSQKLGKIITGVGAKGLKALGQTRRALRAEAEKQLLTARLYVLRPRQFVPHPGQTKTLLREKILA